MNFWQVLVTNVLINDYFIARMIRTLRETTVVTGAVKRSQENVVPGMESPRPVYSFGDTLRSRKPAPLVVCECFGFSNPRPFLSALKVQELQQVLC